MVIRSFAHAGLRRFYERDQTTGLPPEVIDKLRKMLIFLHDMPTVQALRTVPVWKVHQLTGDRKGTYGLHVTRNWRLTFRVVDNELIEVNYEDYH